MVSFVAYRASDQGSIPWPGTYFDEILYLIQLSLGVWQVWQNYEIFWRNLEKNSALGFLAPIEPKYDVEQHIQSLTLRPLGKEFYSQKFSVPRQNPKGQKILKFQTHSYPKPLSIPFESSQKSI